MFCSNMNAHAAIDAVDAPALQEERPQTALERQLARLERLAEAGMELVEALVAQAKGSVPKVEGGDVGLAFSRVSRAVRMAVLLHQQLIQGGVDPAEAARKAEAERKKAHVGRAVRIVQRVAKDHCRVKPDMISAYAWEARERLEDDDIYGLVATRPVGELVALICRDLGLQPNWDALEQEAWAQAEIESGAAGSPFLEDWEDDEDAEGDEAPEPEPIRPTTLQDRIDALAHDPAVLAAARRDSG